VAALLGLLAAIFALAVLPQLLVKRTIDRHSRDRPEFPRTGAEFARQLLDGMRLSGVRVEESALGDHYDPQGKAVRLSPRHYRGRSLAAVVIAAHETGHAMQDATGYPPLQARTRLAKQAERMQQIAAVIMLAAPVVMALVKAPSLLLLEVFIGVMIFALSILVHAVTLPVEFDASFRRALPMLRAGRYIADKDLRSAKRILLAAAFTYVAAAATCLLDVARWLRLLRT
jgi:Zn-dependent membrane protease YugP